MKPKYFSWMALIIITLLLTLTLPAFSVAPPGPIPKPRPPQITSFNINNNAECTYNHTVTLNSVVRGEATEYRVSEKPNFSGASWVSPYRASPGFTLSDGLGTKTVYFQVKNLGGVSNVVNDSIIIKQRPRFPTGRDECDQVGVTTAPGPGAPVVPPDPSIEALNITYARIYDPYTIDINYEILVKNVPGDERLSIELKGETGESRLNPNIIFASTTINYNPTHLVGGGNIRHTGRLTLPIPYDRLVFVSESGSRRSNIFVKAEIKLPSGFTDPNLNNNIRVKMLGLSSRFVTDSHEVDACTGATGDKGDRVFDFTQAIYPSSWVGQSKLDLHDCPDLKCDRNPIPGVGERGIRWVEHPSTAHKFATVHWFCEGLANERQGSHSYFRFTVKTEFIFLFLVP